MERVLKGHFEVESGLVTNSILFCWLFTVKDQRKKVGFSIITPSTTTVANLDCAFVEKAVLHTDP